MRIVAAADHAGVTLKNHLVAWLREKGHEVEDLGTNGHASVDYPDYGVLVARAISEGKADRGVLVCGTGQGMCMTANRFAGVRAAVVSDTFSARATRAHNDANVICLGQRVIGIGLAEEILQTFLTTDFEGGRHAHRVAKVDALNGGDKK